MSGDLCEGGGDGEEVTGGGLLSGLLERLFLLGGEDFVGEFCRLYLAAEERGRDTIL